MNGLTPGQNYFFRLRSVNIYGYSDYSASGSVTTTTVIDDETTNIVMVYPVPAADFVTVKLSENFCSGNILLLDAAGRIVLEREAEPEFTLNLSGLESGLYYIKAGNNVCRIIKN
ncbi:hypothetical protein SDC9_146043 [bioreactor metagenome]|uniref:Fibronectin type-III domain-containing protein n=1 Tax=bioreactor metagenome TaxID=1076179 RepID=A0A645EDL3_9ZZZZ